MKRRAALPPAALPRQRGATLISLMVGLVISMLVTVATLMLYKNLVRATGDSRVNAQFDAQRSAALLMSGMTLQDAGFGIDDPQVGEHLITLKGATLGNAGALQGTPNDCDDKGDGCNATLWLQNMPKPDDPDAPWVTTCSALFSDQDKGGLAKLTAWSGSSPLEGCDLGNWASLTWKAEPLAGAAELRVKESDRLAVMATGLRRLGLRVDEATDGATLHPGTLGSGTIESHDDHRIAMAFAVAGQRSGAG